MVVTRFAAALAVLGSIVACQEPITQPTDPTKLSLSAVAQLACPANSNSIVRSEAELHAALASASPGDVIAVDGFFEVGDAIIRTDDVTLTCATPGSGLRGRGDLGLIVKVIARRVTVSDLVLDATSSVEGAYVAFYNGVTDFGEDIRFLRNTVSCGATNKCVFFGSEVHAGARGGLVADNHITVAGAKFGGVTIQGVDGGRVERNTIVATAPSAHGILANGDERIVVSDNVISGPWSVSLSFSDGVFRSVVERNRLEGATEDAVDLFFVDETRFAHNQVACGPNACLFLRVSPGAVISDNRFESTGSFTGVHLQEGTDRIRVERNTIIATEPSTGRNAGAIRVRDGSDVLVTDNVVRGPWANLIAARNLTSTTIAGNRLEATGPGAGMQLLSMDGVVVERNTLIGAGGSVQALEVDDSPGVVLSHNTIAGSWVDAFVLLNTVGAQVVDNVVTCGSDECVFGGGALGTLVRNNRFTAGGSGSGVHFQGGADGVRIENNEIVATAPSGGPNLGGIRARDGTNVVIAGNVVQGPWSNALALADLADSRIEQNRLEGASRFGAGLGLGVSFRPVSMTGNVVRGNQVRGAGSAGIWAGSACSNTFLGNELQGNAADRGLIFTEMTGANTYVGNRNVVIDNGHFDCDGDAVSDANIVTGPGLARQGITLGGLVQDAVGPPGSKLR